MPTEKAAEGWVAKTPADFKFCFKAHKDVSHLRRLKQEAVEALQFQIGRLASVVTAGKMGPTLIQLPPNFKRNDERLASFLQGMPREKNGVPLRYAMEFRNESWNAKEVEDALTGHGVAWACVETDDVPAQKRDTADFIHCRLRRTEYDDARLRDWAAFLRGAQKECFVFCKHEDEGSPWVWADKLLAFLA
jgi:uncharacterized protein YecE (DUF72 family)